MAGNAVTVFFSYSRKDEALMRELEGHLEPLKLSGLIESWHDGCITPGEEWESQIKAKLNEAQIILLLISVDFIRSDFCNQVELAKAIERYKAGTACVIPVLMRSCLWKPIPVGDMRLGELQALPKDAKPVSKWGDRDDALTNIAEGLFEKVQQLQHEKAEAEYAIAFAEAIAAQYPLSESVIAELRSRQQELGLTSDAIASVEQPIREKAEAKYQQVLAAAERQKQQEAEARRRQEAEDRRRQEAEDRRRQEAAERQQKREEYFNGGTYHLEQGNYDQAISDLEQAQQYGHPEAERYLATARQQQEKAQAEYAIAFDEAVATQYPLTEPLIAELRSLQHKLGLTEDVIASIEQPIRQKAEVKYQQALAAAKRQRQQEAEARRRQEAEIRRRQEIAERQQKREEYFNGGTYHLGQGSYVQAIANFEQAKRYGHPDAERYLATARQQQAAAGGLSSEKNIDYRKLQDLLKAGKWKEADRETYLCMVKAVGREDGDWIRPGELQSFPCADLLTIDHLWVKYSDGQFGFSVQKQIYVECGGQLDGEYPGDKIWGQFADKVGWRKGWITKIYITYNEVTFSTSALRGHLPWSGVVGGRVDLVDFGVSCVGLWGLFSSLASRLAEHKP